MYPSLEHTVMLSIKKFWSDDNLEHGWLEKEKSAMEWINRTYKQCSESHRNLGRGRPQEKDGMFCGSIVSGVAVFLI